MCDNVTPAGALPPHNEHVHQLNAFKVKQQQKEMFALAVI